MEEKICKDCGEQINSNAEICPKCGCRQQNSLVTSQVIINKDIQVNQPRESSKSRLTALLLCLFLGFLGVHRFYVGKVGTGILMLLTVGGFGIVWIIDFFVILCGGFRDADSMRVKKW